MLEKTQKVLEIISNDDIFKNNDIRFVGGTALSHIIKQWYRLKIENFIHEEVLAKVYQDN